MSDDRDARRAADAGGHAAAPGADREGTGRPADFGTMLREARAAKGLELSDIAELTHVRKEYLRALEEGRFDDLPEDVYTRNFVRLYAQAVGISNERAMAAYQAERRRAGGLTTLELRLEQERRGEPPPTPKRSSFTATRRASLPRIGPLIPTLLMVVVLVALAVWGFQTLLFRPTRTPTTAGAGTASGGSAAITPAPAAAPSDGAPAERAGAAAAEAGGGDATTAESASAEPRTVLVTVTSTPEGASVTIDGFALPGVTPIRDAPVTARSGRQIRVTLEGYQPSEQVVDMSQGGTFDVALEPMPAVAAAPADDTGAVGSNQIALQIRASTWLEVYRGTARNEGERLVYTTAEPGQTYLFDLPVYLHVGNAAGVEVTVADGTPFLLGSSGAVVGRAFQNP